MMPDFCAMPPRPASPIGQAITETQARAHIRQYPIPTWINRDSPLYRGWELCDNTWEGNKH